MKIYVVTCKGKSLISKAISLFTGSKITHVGFMIEVENLTFICDSQTDGFQIRSLHEWKKKYNYDYTKFEIPSNYKNVKENIFTHLGVTPYDYKLFIVRYPVHIISSLFNKRKDEIKAVKNESNLEICSESVAHCLGWEDPHTYLPIDVYNRIKTENWNKI